MRIFISSPYRGDVKANMHTAAEYALAVLELGHIPVVPHYAFHYLEGRPFGDVAALYLCCREIETCDEVWKFPPESEGMRFECSYARGVGIPVRSGRLELMKRGVRDWSA